MADAAKRHTPSSVETSVLVVDDDLVKRYALARMLSSRGFRITEAATAAEALRSAFALQPDVMLLDVKLPDLSGFEACERIKSDPATASIPVLLVSAGFTDVLHHVHGLNRGADAYLTGDVEPEVLLATVRSLARMRHSERELRAREQRYHSLIAATASIVWSADAGGNAMEPQPSWEPFTGQSAAQHASSSGYACIHPDDRDRVAMEWHQAVARGHLFETGFRLWHAPTSDTGTWFHGARQSPMMTGASESGSVPSRTSMSANISSAHKRNWQPSSWVLRTQLSVPAPTTRLRPGTPRPNACMGIPRRRSSDDPGPCWFRQTAWTSSPKCWPGCGGAS